MKPKDSSSTQKTISKAPSRGRSSKDLQELVPHEVSVPHVHSQVDDTYKLHLLVVVVGYRAAHNAAQVSAANGPTKLVSMADVSQTKLDQRYAGLKAKNKEK